MSGPRKPLQTNPRKIYRPDIKFSDMSSLLVKERREWGEKYRDIYKQAMSKKDRCKGCNAYQIHVTLYPCNECKRNISYYKKDHYQK